MIRCHYLAAGVGHVAVAEGGGPVGVVVGAAAAQVGLKHIPRVLYSLVALLVYN